MFSPKAIGWLTEGVAEEAPDTAVPGLYPR
jgi:hypothetical protein